MIYFLAVIRQAMNNTNRALMGTLIGIALFYAAFSYLFTVLDLSDVAKPLRVVIDPFGIFGGASAPDALHDAYWGLAGLYTGLAGDDNGRYLAIALLSAGLALVVAGCASKPTRDLKGPPEDPQEYLFTHRPRAFLWCLMAPWNILTVCWRMKKVPVVLPILLLPFMLPFALMMDVILAVLFLAAWAVMTVRIRLAAAKDNEAYERDAQYAVCPKCKRNFHKPDVKCRCGLVIPFPAPDRHGVRYHTCNRGHKIPSTNADGVRAGLKAVCPHCKGEMLTHEAKPLVISLVGSVGSGKTTLMLSAVESIAALAKEKGIVTEIATPGISADAQRRKASVSPTHPGELDSEYFFLRSRDLPEKEVVINDISGTEFYPDRDKVLFEEYYRYNDGIILTVDPLEVMALHRSQSPTKGSKNTPVSTLESFYHMYTEINGYGPAVKSTVPMAVVLTKMDDPKVRQQVDAEPSPEAFLKRHGHKMMVDIVGTAFEDVRYFKVASLGDAVDAMAPFAWILAENDPDLKHRLFG
ncbi:MAG: GTPase domain-containing protein [Methanomassiliicoccaceae archaeon]|nr:GTPase domain-containing protein [Methanomassiliicoccaceae archaeon]